MQIRININDTEVKENLNRLQEKMTDLTPVMKNIGEIIRTSIERNFAAGGRPDKWEKSIRVKEKGGQTLSDRARLRRSFTVKAYSDKAVVGTNVRYAAIHQFGGIIKAKNKPYLRFKVGGRWASKKSVTMPARPFMLVQNEDWIEIKKAMLSYLEGK